MSLFHGTSDLGISHGLSWLGATAAGALAITTVLSFEGCRSWTLCYADLATEVERLRTLDRSMASAAQIRDERHRIISELENEDIDVDQAIERFRALVDVDPVVWQCLCTRYSEHSEEELLGFQVILYASVAPVRDESGRAAFVRKEICVLRERYGEGLPIPHQVASMLANLDGASDENRPIED